MTGLSNSTNQNRSSSTKLELHHSPASWPLIQGKQARAEANPLILSEGEQLPPSRRLVVLIPDADFDIFSLTKKVWNLAAPDRRQVLLLAKPNREEGEYHVRSTLTTLTALIHDNRVMVQKQLVLGMSLEHAVKQYAQPDDILVCFQEHQVLGLLTKKRLADMLAQKVKQPVYTLNDRLSGVSDPISMRLIDFALFAICIATLVSFFALQVWLDQNSAGTFRTILQLLSVLVEVWIIAFCMNRPFKI